MTTTCTRRFEWDAAHRVLRHEGKCATLHGHRYVAEVTFGAESLDSVHRVIDFGNIKNVLGGWIDEHLDHTTILNVEDVRLLKFCHNEWRDSQLKDGPIRRPFTMEGEPTAENIAYLLLQQAREMFDRDGLWVIKVKIYETPNCWAEAS